MIRRVNMRKLIRRILLSYIRTDKNFFVGSYIRDMNFFRADLQRSDFTQAYLNGSQFIKTGLCGSNFFGADIRNSAFRESNLNCADLRNACLINVDLKEVIMTEEDKCFKNRIWD